MPVESSPTASLRQGPIEFDFRLIFPFYSTGKSNIAGFFVSLLLRNYCSMMTFLSLYDLYMNGLKYWQLTKGVFFYCGLRFIHYCE